MINMVKSYPLMQVNAALNHLVEDKNEYISDKYGRIGNLVNIDDLYLFQPLELNNEHISVYDRSVPIEFKRTKMEFELPSEWYIGGFVGSRAKNQEMSSEGNGESIVSEYEKTL